MQVCLLVIGSLLAALGGSLLLVSVLLLLAVPALPRHSTALVLSLCLLIWGPLFIAANKSGTRGKKARLTAERTFRRFLAGVPDPKVADLDWSSDAARLEALWDPTRRLTEKEREGLLSRFGRSRLSLTFPAIAAGVALSGACLFAVASAGASPDAVARLLLLPSLAAVILAATFVAG